MSNLTAEVTLEVDVSYTVISRGRPERGPTYACGGEPAEPAEFEIVVRLEGTDITSALSDEQLETIREQVEEDYNETPDVPDGDYFDDSD